MDTIGRLVYFSSIVGALPLFIALAALAITRFTGWIRIVPFVPAAYVGWMLFAEFGPVLLHWQDLDASDFRRLLYERWSAASRPALVASAVMLGLLLLHKLKRGVER